MKSEIRSPELETNSNTQSSKRYDLEDRTLQFAKDVRLFVAKLPRDIATNEDVKQLVRSSGSVGANYLEANESLSKKDFAMRIKIAKKEARETIWWLELLKIEPGIAAEHQLLLREATELMNILGAILRKSA
jgi:four helix bundle protein